MSRDLGTCCHPLRRHQGQYVARNNDPLLREWVPLPGRLVLNLSSPPSLSLGCLAAGCLHLT